MKVGFFGDGKWSHNALLDIIANSKYTVAFVVPRFKNPDLTLIDIAKNNSIPYHTVKDINDIAFIEKIKEYDCQVLVSMSFNQIFKRTIINQFQIINCHAGKLPNYRGRNILNWALINDEKEFGITVHYVDEGIDTGDIIVQETYPITEEDDYNTLLTKSFEECPKLLMKGLELIRTKEVTPIKQNEISKYGSYCGIRREGDEIINWHQSSKEIYNFIRALVFPGPYARTVLNGKRFTIKKSLYHKEFPKYKGIPGQILIKENNTLTVKTLDSYIVILDYEYEGFIKVGQKFS